jgi:hypothetical protein
VDKSGESLPPAVRYSVDREAPFVRNAVRYTLERGNVDILWTKPQGFNTAYLLEAQTDRGAIHISTALTGTTVFLILSRTIKRRRR